MKEMIEASRAMPDEELVRELLFQAERARRGLAALVVFLSEYDRRRLAQKNGHESTFMFCVRVLRFDESDAYRRVHAARAIRRCDRILPRIESGSLTLTSILLLSPVLTEDNQEAILREAAGKTKREVELLVAGLDPHPAMQDSMRRLPPPPWRASLPPAASPEADQPAAGGAGALETPGGPPTDGPPPEFSGVLPPTPPREWQAIMPLSADRVRIGFDAALAVMRLIDRARQVLRHKYPDGRLEDVVKEALELLLDRKDPQRRLGLKAAAPAPAAPLSGEPRFLRSLRTGRHVPARVKAAVWRRDDGRCAWRFEDGTPCGSRDGLEYDHVRPFSRGGRSDAPRNVRLLCRLHNRLAAERAGLSPGPRPARAGLSAAGGGGA